jgi:hypothetical protein
VEQARSKIGELQREQSLRNDIKVEALKKRSDFSGFPLPTDFDIAGARYLTYVLQVLTGQTTSDLPGVGQRLYAPNSMTVAVGSVGDKLYYALSGKHSKQKIGRFLPELAEFAGSVFARAFAVNTQYDLQQNIGKHMSYDSSSYQIRVCAEPKLWDVDAPTTGYNGMTTLWVGTSNNPFPLVAGQTGFGSAMLPCGRCQAWASAADNYKGKRLRYGS